MGNLYKVTRAGSGSRRCSVLSPVLQFCLGISPGVCGFVELSGALGFRLALYCLEVGGEPLGLRAALGTRRQIF